MQQRVNILVRKMVISQINWGLQLGCNRGCTASMQQKSENIRERERVRERERERFTCCWRASRAVSSSRSSSLCDMLSSSSFSSAVWGMVAMSSRSDERERENLKKERERERESEAQREREREMEIRERVKTLVGERWQ